MTTNSRKEAEIIPSAIDASLKEQLEKVELSILSPPKSDRINCYGGGLPIRINCQTGNFTNSKQEALGNKMSVNIIKSTRYFGDLGMTKGVEWLQLFFIPTVECSFIPKNTVCYSYIKTQSLSHFTELIINIGNQSSEDPAMGIFDLSFTKTAGQYGTYYVLDTQWRKRNNDAEFEQLLKIYEFLQHEPQLEDWRGTADMVAIDDLSAEEYRSIVEQTRELKKQQDQ